MCIYTYSMYSSINKNKQQFQHNFLKQKKNHTEFAVVLKRVSSIIFKGLFYTRKKIKTPGMSTLLKQTVNKTPLNRFSHVSRTQPMTGSWKASHCCSRTSFAHSFGWVSSAAAHGFVPKEFFLPPLSSRVALAPVLTLRSCQTLWPWLWEGFFWGGEWWGGGDQVQLVVFSWSREETIPRIPKTLGRFPSVCFTNWLTRTKAAGRSMCIIEHKDARRGAGGAPSI